MSEFEEKPVGEDLGLKILKIAVDKLTENGSFEIRPGFEIYRVLGKPTVLVNDEEVDLENLHENLRADILKIAEKKRREEEDEKRAPYFDPKTNPMIRLDPDE